MPAIGRAVLVACVVMFGVRGVAGDAFRQSSVPRFEPGPCAMTPGDWAAKVRLECGSLIVYRTRSRPADGTLKLAVAVLRALKPQPGPPLVMVHGGPSGPGGLRGGEMGLAGRWAPLLNRDIIVFDLRGAGQSEPELCPNARAKAADARNLPPDARQRMWIDEARECSAELRASGYDPASFSTPTNAYDAIDLRNALGYASWDVYGVSYGARVAQELMRRDPGGMRGVVLSAPVIPGPEQEAGAPLEFQHALDRLFEACAAQPSCATSFPTPAADLERLIAELNAKPIDVSFESAEGLSTVRLDGERLIRALHDTFARRLSRVPLFVDRMLRGDREATARALLGFTATGAGNNMLTNLVGCFESGGPVAYEQAIAAKQRELRPPYRVLLNDIAECPFLQKDFAAPGDRSFVKSSIPTLIVTQEFDDRTPTSHGWRIAEHLANARVVEIPAQGHGQPPNACSQSIILAFLADPVRSPDVACLKDIQPVAFDTANLEPINMFLSISTTAEAARAFAGQWEGTFPGAPVIYRIEVTIAGDAVTGRLIGSAQTIPIENGRIADSTITFTVRPANTDRTITFTGRLDGDTLAFTRDVDVGPSGAAGGAALLGSRGARTFSLVKVK